MQGSKGSSRAISKVKTPQDIDFSFLDICDVADLQHQKDTLEPREVGLKKEKPKKNDDGKYDTRVVRLYNNKLEEFKDLYVTLEAVVVDPKIITWIDLSLNAITLIDACICDFPSLQILYLHGNQIAKLPEVDKLAGIPGLRKLTLHGNPIAADKFYKAYVLTRIQGLQSFDMAVITKADRTTCNTLSSMKPAKKSRKKDE